jgi:hypothetical protein
MLHCSPCVETFCWSPTEYIRYIFMLYCSTCVETFCWSPNEYIRYIFMLYCSPCVETFCRSPTGYIRYIFYAVLLSMCRDFMLESHRICKEYFLCCIALHKYRPCVGIPPRVERSYLSGTILNRMARGTKLQSLKKWR